MRLLALAALLAAAPAAAACTGNLCDGDSLAPLFRKLAVAREAHGVPPVHILQIGDSHTAGDQITGAWRTALQTRYRSGGRGVMAAGRPYDGYLTRGITATMSPGWRVSADFGKSYADPHPPLGLAGFSLTSQVSGATIGLVADANEAFDRFVLCGIAEPGGGTLDVQVGQQTQSLDFGSMTRRPECRTIRAGGPTFTVTVTSSEQPVTITSWATFRDDGGVAVSNVGVVGSQLVHFARTDDAVLAEELRSYRPDLIVLAFGTNEGFTPNFSAFSYEITLRTQVGRLRRLAGRVPILLLGAPDASSRQAVLRSNAPGGAVDCAPAAAPAPAPAQVDPFAATMAGIGFEAAQEGQPFALPPTPAPVAPRPAAGLFAPPALAAVRAVQRRVAHELGLAFWDWGQAMGGACTAPKWVKAATPLMRGDYVHYTSAGGREIAARLAADLDRAAQAER